jgi:hypothetical protein
LRVGLALLVKERMNIRTNHYPAIGLAFSILPAIVCNSGTFFATSTPARLHIDNEVVAFDYMEGMDLFEGGDAVLQCIPDFQLGGELVVGLGSLTLGFDRYFRSIRIFRQPMLPDSNLETIMQEAYLRADPYDLWGPGVMDTTSPVTVAGLVAFQTKYRIYIGEPAYELRDVWIPKGDELFIVAIWTQYTNSEAFAAFQANADLLLNSLQLK